jgi:biotin transport system substrate-specific component
MTVNTISLQKENSYVKDVLIVVLSGLLIGLIGHLSIYFPFTPVPISFRLQTILFLSLLLGSRRSLLAVAFFLAQGAFGLPVFAGGLSGLAGLVGPNGGYIVGYLMAAFVAGLMSERGVKPVFSFLAGTLIVYVSGASYLATWVGVQEAILLGIAPFILLDVLKTVASLKLLSFVKNRG